MQLSVIIVSYNVKYFLEQCLCALQKAIANISAEVIIIDNASSDGSLQYLERRFPAFHFTGNLKNTGYARANNQGLQRAKGKYVLFLNPDTLLPEDCLEQLLHFVDTHPQCGACGIRMLDGNGRFLPESKRAFPSLTTSFYKLSGLTALFPQSKRFARYYLAHLSENKSQEVDVLSGAFFLSAKQVLDKAGGFDEQFFMYGEDIDLSYRLQQAGYTNFYFAATSIIHFKGQSTRKQSFKYVLLFYKAMSLFVQKHYNGTRLWWFMTVIQTTIWLRAALSAITNLFLWHYTHAPVGPVKTCIVGSLQQVADVTAIMSTQPRRNILSVLPGPGLERCLTEQSPAEIIFCEGTLSYKAIIELMEHLPVSISFMIHGAGSNSLVGNAAAIGNRNDTA